MLNDKFVEYLTTEPLFGPYSIWLAELCNITKGMHVLDVGCGIGVSTFPLLDIIGPKGKITGVDISLHLISQALRRAEYLQVPNASFSVCNAEKLDFPDSIFDCVVSSFVINQVSDKSQALSEMIRVLKPGGYLGFTIPGSDHFKEFFNIAASILKEESFYRQKNKLQTGSDTYQALLRSLGIVDLQVYSKVATVNISTIEEYDVILKTRGPQNAVLSRLPENRRTATWQEIINEFNEKLTKDQYLHLTISAHGFVLRKPFM
jgi:SAM-dependent methyltransferase